MVFTITKPGSYKIKRAIVTEKEDKVKVHITCNDVTLDLDGHNITASKDTHKDSIGILISGKRIIVKNGMLSRLEKAIVIEEGENVHFEGLSISLCDIVISSGVMSGLSVSNMRGSNCDMFVDIVDLSHAVFDSMVLNDFRSFGRFSRAVDVAIKNNEISLDILSTGFLTALEPTTATLHLRLYNNTISSSVNADSPYFFNINTDDESTVRLHIIKNTFKVVGDTSSVPHAAFLFRTNKGQSVIVFKENVVTTSELFTALLVSSSPNDSHCIVDNLFQDEGSTASIIVLDGNALIQNNRLLGKRTQYAVVVHNTAANLINNSILNHEIGINIIGKNSKTLISNNTVSQCCTAINNNSEDTYDTGNSLMCQNYYSGIFLRSVNQKTILLGPSKETYQDDKRLLSTINQIALKFQEKEDV